MVALARQNHAKVLLVGMRMPPNYGRAYTERFFGMYQELSTQTSAPLVPFMLEGVADKPDLFQQDRLHPVAQAHPTILSNIWPKFSALIKSR
jgi:acyl-CoA thioesterase-1